MKKITLFICLPILSGLIYTSVANAQQCNGTTALTTSSGAFGALGYGFNSNCNWLIQPAGVTKITLTFISFDTETGVDIVKVYDGSDSMATLIGSYSGMTLPPTITSTGNALYIHFTSDAAYNYAGWNASYTSFSSTSFKISGKVMTKNNTAPLKSGQVFLIKKIVTSTMTMKNIDSVFVDTSGIYSFKNSFPSGYYMLLAKPDKKNYPNTLSTYYGDMIYWKDAKLFFISADTMININMKEMPYLAAGKGLIKGKLMKGKAYKMNGPGDPLKGINVSLVKSGNSIPVKNTVTDSVTGEFSFTNLPIGSYNLLVDVTGIPIDSSLLKMNLNITATDSVVNNVVLEMDSNLIYTTATFINEQMTYDNAVLFYPNPFSNSTNLRITNHYESTKYELMVYDLLGREVINSQFQAPNSELFRGNLQNGMYFYKLYSIASGKKQGQLIGSGKIIVQ